MSGIIPPAMSAVTTAFKARYYAGESAKIAVEATDATAVKVVCGSSSYSLSEDDGVWSASIPTDSLVGRMVWTVFVTLSDGSVEVPDGGRGASLVLCAGRSPKWEVVEKIDEAIRSWGTSPNRSISIGEISITYKSLDELLAIRAQYVQQAEAEESGAASSGGVRMVEVCF